MDVSMIEKIEQLAIDAAKANRVDMTTPAFICGNAVHSLEHLQAGRSRYRGTFKTTSIEAFADYVNAHGDAVNSEGFINAKDSSARVYINAGSASEPGHADWTATLNLDMTAPYQAMLAFVGKGAVSQRGMLDFLEDWAPYLAPVYKDEADASRFGAALTGIRNITITAKKETAAVERDFGAKRSALEDIEANSDGLLPGFFDFVTEPHAGFSLRTFRLRLSVLTGEKPSLALRIVGYELHQQDIGIEFAGKCSDLIQSVSMSLGTFTP